MESQAMAQPEKIALGEVAPDTFNWMASRYLWQTRRVSWNRYPRWMDAVTQLVAGWQPASVVDLGCGPGYLLGRLNEILPNSRLMGVDFAQDMLAKVPSSIPTMRSRIDDWAQSSKEHFDAAVLSFVLRDQADITSILRPLIRRLRPGGHLVILETHTPKGWRKWGFEAYVHRLVPWWADRSWTRDWSLDPLDAPYRWISRSHQQWEHTYPNLPRILYEAGYRKIQVHTAESDVVMLCSGSLPDAAGG